MARSDRRFTYTHRAVKRMGHRDGRDWRWRFFPFRTSKARRPEPEARAALREREFKEAAESDMELYANQWREEDREHLKEDFCQAESEYERARQVFAVETEQDEGAHEVFEVVRREYLKAEQPGLNPQWMLVWLAVIGAGEFFLNSVVFQVLGSGELETYIAALAVGLGIPVAADLLGRHLKQEHKTSLDWKFILATPIAVLGGLAVLAVLRTRFVEAQRDLGMLPIEVSPLEFIIVFLLLNVLLFVIATFLAYAGSHRDGARYRELRRAYRAEAKRLKQESSETETALRRLEEAERRLHEAREGRRKRYQEFRQLAVSVNELADLYSLVYRNANLHVRPDKPRCFEQDPPSHNLPLPDALRAEEPTDWDCSERYVEEAGVAASPELAVT